MSANKGQFTRGNQAGKGHGRPAGKGRRQVLLDAIGQDGFDKLIKSIHDAALSGDMQAAGLLLNRIIPAIRPVSPDIQVSLTGDLLEQAQAIVGAAASGAVPVSEAKALLDSLGSVAKIKVLTELEQRISALEAGK